MKTYIFRRAEGFYPVTMKDDAGAVANAECNPGTLRIECAATGRRVWPALPQAVRDEVQS